MKQAIASLKGVWKYYGSGDGRIAALQDITLDLHAGELTMIEGPSGGGKTTLLQILGLLLPADQGAVTVAGRTWSGCSESELTLARRRHVAFVFQDFNLLASLSAHDNVAVVAGLHHRDGDQMARELMARLDLADRSHHLPGEMSGGQKQRVSIGRALASRGELVLADEPTANLDWRMGEPVVRLLQRIARQENRAVVIVTHDARIEPFADRIIRLADGRIQNDNRPTKEVAVATTASSGLPPDPAAGAAPLRPAPGRRSDPPADAPAPRWRLKAAALLLVLLALAVVTYKIAVPGRNPTAAASTGMTDRGPAVVVAAPAVVEPPSRTVKLMYDRLGLIKAVLVKPGELVQPNQVLVQLDDDDARAEVEVRQAEVAARQSAVSVAESQVAAAQAALDDLLAWFRAERKQEAQAQYEAAKARVARAQFEYERVEKLRAGNITGELELRIAKEAIDVARAEAQRAKAQWDLAEAGPTDTEVGKAKAGVTEAKARVTQARQMVEEADARLRQANVALEQRKIKSPLCGRVLYVHQEPGEIVSFEHPVPIISLAAEGKPRLRAEVDEADIGRVFVGQKVQAVSDAYPDRAFTGRVLYVEQLMGRRNIRTDRASTKQDTRIQEVVIELDQAAEDLPIDLQMTVRFLAGPGAATRPARGV